MMIIIIIIISSIIINNYIVWKILEIFRKIFTGNFPAKYKIFWENFPAPHHYSLLWVLAHNRCDSTPETTLWPSFSIFSILI